MASVVGGAPRAAAAQRAITTFAPYRSTQSGKDASGSAEADTAPVKGSEPGPKKSAGIGGIEPVPKFQVTGPLEV